MEKTLRRTADLHTTGLDMDNKGEDRSLGSEEVAVDLEDPTNLASPMANETEEAERVHLEDTIERSCTLVDLCWRRSWQRC